MEITRQNETQERQKTKPWILPSSWRLQTHCQITLSCRKCHGNFGEGSHGPKENGFGFGELFQWMVDTCLAYRANDFYGYLSYPPQRPITGFGPMKRGKLLSQSGKDYRRNGGNMQWQIQWHAADGQAKNPGSTIMARFQTSL